MSDLEAVKQNLASLNEIIGEMVSKVSDDPEFTAMTRDVLRAHSWSLGFEFQGERRPADYGRCPGPGGCLPDEPCPYRADDCAPR